MGTYTRKISSHEINALGPDWNQKIEKIINQAISAAIIATDPKTTTAKVLEAMGKDVPMTVSGIVSNYNILHGVGKMSDNYGRFVVAGLYKHSLIKRVRHGVYMRGD